jgi:hypothetical protein
MHTSYDKLTRHHGEVRLPHRGELLGGTIRINKAVVADNNISIGDDAVGVKVSLRSVDVRATEGTDT